MNDRDQAIVQRRAEQKHRLFEFLAARLVAGEAESTFAMVTAYLEQAHSDGLEDATLLCDDLAARVEVPEIRRATLVILRNALQLLRLKNRSPELGTV